MLILRMKMTSWASCLPNKIVQYLSVDEVLEIHAALIERFGGADGLRDMGLLECVLYRPQSGYYADLVEMAAAMFESLINNHPFVDGNKHVAFFSVDVFLRLNGYKVSVDATSAYEFLMGLFASNTCDLEHLKPWIRSITIEV